MKQEISERFALNIARVRNLVSIYRNQLSGSGKGRRGHQETDVLRAAVVLLHASMEDVLRSLAYWKLPSASPAVLEKIAMIGGSNTKFHLGNLAAHRGKTVEQVIKESVDAYLERSNYNNCDEVTGLLGSIGLNIAPLQSYLPALESSMKRRHQIVHRADANPNIGRGRHKVTSISPKTLDDWIANLESFAQDVLSQV